MHDLQLVTGLHLDAGPGSSRSDLSVVFDGDAVAFQLQSLDELAEFYRICPIGKASLVPIDLNIQGATPILFKATVRVPPPPGFARKYFKYRELSF